MAIDLDDQLQSYFAWIERQVGLPMHKGPEDGSTPGSSGQLREDLTAVRVLGERRHAGPRRLAYVAAASLVIGSISGIAYVRSKHNATDTVATYPSVASTTPTDVPADSTLPSTVTSLDIADSLAPGVAELLPVSPLAGRIDPMAVWSGSQMLIWGGSAPKVPSGETPFDDGATYDPITKEWTSLPPAPISARSNAASVWTGAEMLIWGGSENGTSLFDGAAFNPVSNTWRLLPTFDLAATVRPTAVWTGSEMVVLEGINGSPHGGAFDPATNSWRTIATPPGRSATPYPQAVWTGTEVVATLTAGSDDNPIIASYNPTTDSWEELAASLSFGQRPRLLWTGTTLLAFGMADTGASTWDPATHTWRSSVAVPTGAGLSAQPVWTGELAVFWNGGPAVAIYDPAADTWGEALGGDIASPRLDGARLWADGILLAWGGFISNPDGSASGASDGIAWRPKADPSQSTVPKPPSTTAANPVESTVSDGAQSRTLASELGVVTYEVPVGTVDEVLRAPTLPDFVVGYDQWIVTDCCLLKVALQSVQPLMSDEELVDTFISGGLTWRVYDDGPRDGTQISAIATSGPLSVLVSVQKGFSIQPINSSATEVASSVARTVMVAL